MLTTVIALLGRVPKWMLWALLALFLVLLVVDEVRIGVMRSSLAQARQRVAETVATLQTERSQAAQVAADTQAKYRAIEQERAQRLQEIQHAHDTRLTALRSDAARASAAADRLRAQLAILSARLRGQAAGDPATPGDGQAAGSDPGMLPELFGRCVERVRLLAQHADESRSAGLQCEQTYGALNSE